MHYDGPSYYRKKEQADHKKGQRTRPQKAYQRPLLKNTAKETNKQAAARKKNNHFFRRKYIPPSLQKLEGWKKTEWPPELLAELKKRLFKTDQSYLLFESALEKENNQKDLVAKTAKKRLQ